MMTLRRRSLRTSASSRPQPARARSRPAWRVVLTPRSCTLARLSRTHASGILELSSRANVQLRGVSTTRHAGLLRALAGCGLLDADVRSE
ncbi:MAG: hypothetical protein EOO33_17825, partial [Comamonadaceae bacterium]